MALSVDIIDTLEGLERVSDEWVAFLEGRAASYFVFQDPRAFAAFIDKERGRASPLVAIVRDGPAIVAVAPFFVFAGDFKIALSVLRLAKLPARMLKLQNDRFVFDRGTARGEVVRAVMAALEAERARFDFVVLPELTLPNEIVETFEAAGDRLGAFSMMPSTVSPEKAYAHRLAESYEAYLSTIGAKRRKNMRRDTKLWRGDKGKPGKGKIHKITRPEQVPAFLDQVDAIFQNTWQAKTFGVYKRNEPAFIHYLQTFARMGWLRSYLLERADGTPIAFVLGYQGAGTLHYEDIGYDLRFAGDHPGVALSYMMMEELYADDPPRLVDFGYGDNRYKEALSNEVSEARSIYLVASPRWRATILARRGLDRVYGEARRLVQRAGLETKMRDLLKRRGATEAAPAGEPSGDAPNDAPPAP